MAYWLSNGHATDNVTLS